jgi:transcription elongation factor GreB
VSKAFTREADDLPERPIPLRAPSALPAGAKNYLTVEGERRLHDELDTLMQTRGELAQLTDDAAALRKLPAIDQRINELRQSLLSAVVVPKPEVSDGTVRFGATVTVRDGSGEERRYRIVGIDETDLDRGWVSWVSPIARALLNARLGERVRFKYPSGEEELEVVRIDYE